MNNDMVTFAVGKIRKSCRDVTQTCEIAELDRGQAVQIVMSALLGELVRGAAVLQVTELDFIKLCRHGYRQIYPQVREGLDE